MNQLHKFYRNPPTTIEAFEQENPHQITEKLKEILDQMSIYSDHKFGQDLVHFSSLSRIKYPVKEIKKIIKRKWKPLILVAEDRDEEFKMNAVKLSFEVQKQ